MFAELRIGTKLLFAFVGLALVSAATGAVDLHACRSLSAETYQRSGGLLPSLDAPSRAQERFTADRFHTARGILSAGQGDRSALETARSKAADARRGASEWLGQYGAHRIRAEEASLWGKVQPAFQAYQAAREE
jgi:hypothetical protein